MICQLPQSSATSNDIFSYLYIPDRRNDFIYLFLSIFIVILVQSITEGAIPSGINSAISDYCLSVCLMIRSDTLPDINFHDKEDIFVVALQIRYVQEAIRE